MATSFGGMPLSPSKNESLLGATSSYTMDVNFTVHSARNLIAAAQDGLTSNCQCECVLQFNTRKNAALPIFKTKVAKTTRNPIWSLSVEAGKIDLKDLEGIQLVVKHVTGFSAKSMGEAFVSVDFLADLERNLDENGGAWFAINPSPDMPRLPSYGEVRLVFNQAAPAATTTAAAAPTLTSESIPMVAAAVQHVPVAELRGIKASNRAVPQRGETWYAISSMWLERWLVFVADLKHTSADAPGPITNDVLFESPTSLNLRETLHVKQDYRLLDEASWKLYLTWYGGGPAISVTVPKDVPSVSKWMTSLSLARDATIDPAP
ncbi:Aste57867_17163 [Aphanomyces stellatus]|uniref:Aste57867_17163 protein n=1 Tax=Aphanomyces stellatus TaxID=120398 RepID=A0A485L8T2_9STRA|nr:hypothetical protein As57867_017104 [Aphanomyces stellatus]VFT93920.1 Aste57867_17163 [Aphanomyces stellatus]